VRRHQDTPFYAIAFALTCTYLIASYLEKPGVAAVFSSAVFAGLMVICAAVASEAARYPS